MGLAMSSGDAWSWRLEALDGREIPLPVDPPGDFPSQADAESWIGETWRGLLDAGAEQATLFEGDRKVYGPMSLRPLE